jgi:hypothetical protein
MTDHIADRAGFLAALPQDDPERGAADEHAKSCAPCREALDDGVRLMGLLRQALPFSPPLTEPSSARRPVFSPTASDLGAPAAGGLSWPAGGLSWPAGGLSWNDASRRFVWTTVGAVVVAWLFQLTVGGGFQLDRECLVVSLGILAVAIASVTVMRGKERLAVVTVVATSGLFAFLSGTAAGLSPGIGIRCTFRELWAAAITWAIVVTIGRRRGVAFSRWNVTAIAAAGALAAHAGQHLACAVPHSDAHLLVFHFGGVLAATLLAAVSVRRGAAVAA